MIVLVLVVYFYVLFGENDNMYFGVLLIVLFGFKIEYDCDWVGCYNGVKIELQVIDLGVVFFYDVNLYLLFGVLVFVECLNVDLISVVDIGIVINVMVQCIVVVCVLVVGGIVVQVVVVLQVVVCQVVQFGFLLGIVDGYLCIKGDEVLVGYILGMMVILVEGINIVFSYCLKVEYKIIDGKVDFIILQNVVVFLVIVVLGIFIDSNGCVIIILLVSVIVGFIYCVNDQWQIMVEVMCMVWSKFDQVMVDYDFNQLDSVLLFYYCDIIFVLIGIDFCVNDKLILCGGLVYDQILIIDVYCDVCVLDIICKWLLLGLIYVVLDKMEYSVGYIYLFIKDLNIILILVIVNIVIGKYKVSGDVLVVLMQYKF